MGEFYTSFVDISTQLTQKFPNEVGEIVFNVLDNGIPDEEQFKMPGRHPLTNKEMIFQFLNMHVFTGELSLNLGFSLPNLMSHVALLSSQGLWEDVFSLEFHSTSFDNLKAKNPDIAELTAQANRPFFENWLTMSAMAVVLGSQFEDMILEKGRRQVSYYPSSELADKFETVVSGKDDLRKRLIQAFGSTQTGAGSAYKIIKEVLFERNCPAPALTNVLAKSFGDYLEIDENWNRFWQKIKA